MTIYDECPNCGATDPGVSVLMCSFDQMPFCASCSVGFEYGIGGMQLYVCPNCPDPSLQPHGDVGTIEPTCDSCGGTGGVDCDDHCEECDSFPYQVEGVKFDDGKVACIDCAPQEPSDHPGWFQFGARSLEGVEEFGFHEGCDVCGGVLGRICVSCGGHECECAGGDRPVGTVECDWCGGEGRLGQ